MLPFVCYKFEQSSCFLYFPWFSRNILLVSCYPLVSEFCFIELWDHIIPWFTRNIVLVSCYPLVSEFCYIELWDLSYSWCARICVSFAFTLGRAWPSLGLSERIWVWGACYRLALGLKCSKWGLPRGTLTTFRIMSKNMFSSWTCR